MYCYQSLPEDRNRQLAISKLEVKGVIILYNNVDLYKMEYLPCGLGRGELEKAGLGTFARPLLANVGVACDACKQKE